MADKTFKGKISAKGTEIAVLSIGNDDDFISLTDIAKYKNQEEPNVVVANWLRNRNTVEFIGIWEQIHNPDFNYGGFATIKSRAGLNNYKISVKEWVEQTNAIGLTAKAGRYGGTYAHRDIAFEFGMWISPEFKIFLIREFDRLKTEEQQRLSLEWNLQRTISKINYRIHTDAIKAHIIPPVVTKYQAKTIYATEADMLNVALFGKTAAGWKNENPSAIGNIRDEASLEQLIVLSNMESINALLIEQGIPQHTRLIQLNQVAITQMTSLLNNRHIQKLDES